jgi:hypothetical protein
MIKAILRLQAKRARVEDAVVLIAVEHPCPVLSVLAAGFDRPRGVVRVKPLLDSNPIFGSCRS